MDPIYQLSLSTSPTLDMPTWAITCSLLATAAGLMILIIGIGSRRIIYALAGLLLMLTGILTPLALSESNAAASGASSVSRPA